MITTGTDIFTIDKVEHTDSSIKAILSINKHSEIFNGHFPGQPVVPGACMLQIVKDVLENELGTSLLLKKADNLKFISMLQPGHEAKVELTINYKIVDKVISLNAKINAGDVIFFKFQGSFLEL